MSHKLFVVLFLCFISVQCEYLTKKFCKSENPHQCEVYNVILDPCTDGASFCTIKRTKRYILTIDFLPRFSATKVNISMYGDDNNDGTFSKVIKSPVEACNVMTCPVQAGDRRLFDLDFSLGKTFAVGKFPVQVKLYNEDNEKQNCCFTFNVKTKK